MLALRNRFEYPDHPLGKVTRRKVQIRTHKKANYLNFRAAGQGPGAAWRSALYSTLQETLVRDIGRIFPNTWKEALLVFDVWIASHGLWRESGVALLEC